MEANRLVFRVHAIRRMFQRHISEKEVRHVLEAGETIETYPEERPYPSRLALGRCESRPLHVVVADDTEEQETIVITVHEPDEGQWEGGFSRGATMKCVICRNGETTPGKATVTLERDGMTLVIKGVPARICANCGEEYVDEETTARLLKTAEEAACAGVQVDVREYIAA